MRRRDPALLAGLHRASDEWSRLDLPPPAIALCTGSGLSLTFGEPIYGPVPLADWVPFPVRPLPGHPHELTLIELEGPSGRTHVLHFRGRIHAYQGYDAGEVVFATRLAGLLGARIIVQGNAAGSLHSSTAVGSVSLIEDHLNLTGLNPLRGDLPSDWPTSFVDMTEAYSSELRDIARVAAQETGLELSSGVYAGLLGPSFETPAEIAALRRMGADLVGMSTVLEVIASRHMGMRCMGFSLVTNLAAGLVSEIGHEAIFEVGRSSWPQIGRWLHALLSDSRLR